MPLLRVCICVLRYVIILRTGNGSSSFDLVNPRRMIKYISDTFANETNINVRLTFVIFSIFMPLLNICNEIFFSKIITKTSFFHMKKMNQKHVAWLYNYMITQLSLDLFYHNMIIYVGILHTNRNVDVLQDLLKKITRHIKKSNNNKTINWMPTNRIKLKMCNHVPTHTLPIFNSSNSALLKFSELIIFGDSFLFEMAKQRN